MTKILLQTKAMAGSMRGGEVIKVPFNILKFYKFLLSCSLFVSVLSLFFVFTKGFNKSVDFAGGYLIGVSCNEAVDISICKEKLVSEIAKSPFVSSETKTLDGLVFAQFNTRQIPSMAQAEQIKSIINTSGQFTIAKSDFLTQKFGSQLSKSGLLAVIFTLLAIFSYLFIRFSLGFAISAVITLFHDTIVLLGFLSLCQIELDLSIIAAILTVIGYSVNDSVIIFDRIRENRSICGDKMSLYNELILSSFQTLSRTTMTSLTTLFSVIAIIFFAGSPVHGFGYTVLFGIVLGTYSSIFVSAPLLLFLKKFDSKL